MGFGNMIDSTPQDAPQQQAQPQSAAPQSGAPAPTPTPTQTPQPPAAQVQSPTATAPATMRPSAGSGASSVLSGIVLGGLMGAAHGAQKVAGGIKTALRNGMYNSEPAQRARASNLQQQEGQQRMKLAEKQESREEQKSMDEHTEAQYRMALSNAQQLNYGVQSKVALQDADINKGKYLAEVRKANTEFSDQLNAMGTSPEELGLGNMPKGFGTSLSDGSNAILTTGTAENPIVQSYSQADLNMPIPHTLNIPKWSMDKNGTITKTTVPMSRGSMSDAWKLYHQNLKEYSDMEELQKQNQATQDAASKRGLEAGQTAEAFGKAALDREQAKQAAGGITDANRGLTGEAFISTLPSGMQDAVRGLLRYQYKSTDLGRGKEKLPIMEAAVHADPTWSQNKYNERYQYLQEYGGSKTGDGATRNRINTAIGHLDLLNQAGNALAQNNVQALNDLANRAGVATGKSAAVVYDAIAEKAGGEIAGAVKGGGASATDPALEKAEQHLDHNMSPAQRAGVMRAQAQILATMVGTISGKFQSTMGQSPTQFGQPVLFGGNDQTLYRMTAPNGATGYAPDATGTLYWHDANGKVLSKVAGQ